MTAKKRTVKKSPKKGTVIIEGPGPMLTLAMAPTKVKKPAGPKAGDIVSMAFHYIGLVSWEEAEVEKVAKGKEVLWISNQLYEKKDNGTYVYEDNTLGPCKKVLHLDGGKQAHENEEK